MPDITMCNGETCALSETCYRSPQSGTVPNGDRQSWFIEEPYWRDGRGPTVCDHYWKIEPYDKGPRLDDRGDNLDGN